MRSDGIPILSQGLITTNYRLSCGVMLQNNDTLIYGGNFIGSQFPKMHTCDLIIQDEEAMKNFEKNDFISHPYYCEYLKFYTEALNFFYRNLE